MVDTRAAPELPPGLDCLPPTADDLPYDDGVPLESDRHAINLRLLVLPLRRYLTGRRSFYIGSNMFVYFSPDQASTHDFRGPDFFVVLDVPPGERKSWVVWQEDGRVPNLVIELMSDSTATIDRTEKRRIYQDQLHVPEYIRFHPWTAELAADRMVDARYQPINQEADGSLISHQLDLKLVIWEGEVEGTHARWLRWATLDGTLLPTGDEAAESAGARANAADARAEIEHARAEAERARAEAERARAEAEREQAEAFRAELERYRARFGNLPPGS